MSALGGLRPPAAVQGVRCLVLLGLAGGMDGPLDQPWRPLRTVRPQPVQLGVDLIGALGEPADQCLGHALELAVAVAVRWCPLHPECPDELALVGGPVDGVRSQPMPIQVPAVQGRPPSVRAPGPGWPRPDGCAAAGHPLWTSGGRSRPPARPVRTRAGHRRGRGGPPGARPGRRPPRPARRDGRPAPPGRWPGHPGRRGSRRSWSAAGPHRTPGRRCGHGAAQQLARRRVAALEHGLEPGRRCFALQPQAGGAGAVPPARGLAVAGQILLVVGGQLTGVIGLPAHRQLGDVGHHPPLPPAFVGASNAPLVHCSPQKMVSGVRVGRKLACERRLRGVRGCGYFLVRSDRQLWEAGVWQEPWTADRRRHGWRAQERWD